MREVENTNDNTAFFFCKLRKPQVLAFLINFSLHTLHVITIYSKTYQHIPKVQILFRLSHTVYCRLQKFLIPWRQAPSPSTMVACFSVCLPFPFSCMPLPCFLLYTHHHCSNLLESYTYKTAFLYVHSPGAYSSRKIITHGRHAFLL